MIYIVEDDSAIRELEQYALQSNGYEAVGFESSEPFWQAVHTTPPELVILDVMLPGEDGFSILKKLRAAPSLRRLPIIMITAKSSELDTVRGLDCGADDYITKPFGIMEFLSRVRAALRRAEPEARPNVYSFREILLDNARHSVTVSGAPVELTYKDTSDDDKEKTVTFYVGSKDDSATYYYVQMDGSQRVSRVLIDTVDKALGWKVDSSAE